MKTMKKIVFGMLCISLLFPFANLSAHSGRTDGSGGHHDNKNASGLGSYHYHCGGHPAHLHNNGICPYSPATTKPATQKKSKYYKTATVRKVQNKLNRPVTNAVRQMDSMVLKQKLQFVSFRKKRE